MDKLILGDCVEELKNLETESVDLVVTSPPYDSLRTYGDIGRFTFGEFKLVAANLARVIKMGSVIVWVVGDQTINGTESGTSFRQALYFKDECELRLHDTMIYQKEGLAFPETNRYYPEFEYMFVLSKGAPKTANLIRDRKNIYAGDTCTGTQREADGSRQKMHGNGKNVYQEMGVRMNIWRFGTGFMKSTKDKEAYEHPAIFPEALAADHIRTWSNEGDTVLDPFMGSGTTIKMAALASRKYIGIERNPEYFALAEKRIDSSLKQGDFFRK